MIRLGKINSKLRLARPQSLSRIQLSGTDWILHLDVASFAMSMRRGRGCVFVYFAIGVFAGDEMLGCFSKDSPRPLTSS